MIPKAFLARMKQLLGKEYPSFLSSVNAPAVKAVRVNTAKLSVEAFCALAPFALRPIPYAEEGFYIEEEKPGNHPLHHAGAFYVQDPGAMCTAAAVSVEKGWRVLDVCAAPGGKSSQLAAMIGEDGVLVANEINLPRCRVLAGNLERLGMKNTIVTNTDAQTLAGWFDGYFDLTLVDAPCSGEGMFRKYDYAGDEWNEASPAVCAARQMEILCHAAKTVRRGGYLLYSTCTFSKEENEETVMAFLKEHPEFSLRPVKDSVIAHTSAAIGEGEITLARRFYPHIAPGEGQFLALLQKSSDAPEGRGITYKDASCPIPKKDADVVNAFLKDVLGKGAGNLHPVMAGDTLVLSPLPLPPFRVFSSGVAVGTLQKGRLEPHHQFFMAYGNCFLRRLSYPSQSAEVEAYLRGETFPCPDAQNGYAAILADGCTLGGVKVVSGMAKNHYPKGLRKR